MLKSLKGERGLSLSFLLLVAVFFTSTWDLLFKLDTGGFTLKLYQPLAFCALLALLWEKRKLGVFRILEKLKNPFVVPMAILAFFYLGTSPWSEFPLKSFLYSTWFLFQITTVYLVSVHSYPACSERKLVGLVWATMLFLSYVILVDYAYYYLGFKGGLIGWNQDKITNLGLSRPHAFSSEPSFASTFMSLGLLTTSLAAYQFSKRKWVFLIAFLVVCFAIIATTSRTGWLCLGIGFSLLGVSPLLVGKKIHWKTIRWAIGLVIALVSLFWVTTPKAQRDVMMFSFVGSIFRGDDSSGNSRLKAHILAWNISKETNFLGTGMGASYRYYKVRGGFDYNHREAFNASQYGSEMIMSTWGQLLAEGGLIGVLLFLAAAFGMIRNLFLKWKKTQAPLLLGSLAGAIVFFFFAAFWLGNINRGDVWVWYGLWSAIGSKTNPDLES